MKQIKRIGTLAFLLLFAVAVPAFAQEQREEGKPEARPEGKAEMKPEAKNEAKPVQEEKQKETKAVTEHRTTVAKQAQPAPHGGGGRIPDAKFRAHFGNAHRFRVTEASYQNRRFQYGGYWFGFVDAWPSNWLYTQDVYVVDINGVYYLCNAMYPGVNVTLSVTL